MVTGIIWILVIFGLQASREISDFSNIRVVWGTGILKLLVVLGLLGVLACHKYQISDIRPIKVSGILAIQGLLVLLD